MTKGKMKEDPERPFKAQRSYVEHELQPQRIAAVYSGKRGPGHEEGRRCKTTGLKRKRKRRR